jgi:hypothetical protein
MAGIEQTRRLRLAPLAAVLALAILIWALGSARDTAPASAQTTCPPLPAGLAPNGSGPTRFTMLIRINQIENVGTYTNFNETTGGLGGRIRPQDVFVINTRFDKSIPANWTQMASDLRAAFPCNRIIALNGMSFNPLAPGYAFALLDHPAVYGLISDFEQGDWNAGRSTDPGRPPWNSKFKVTYPRAKQWNGRVATALATNAAAAGKRSGLVPWDGGAEWNYGQIQQDLDKKNIRLGRKLGLQSVMTQDACANGGASSFRERAKALYDQYRFKFVTKVKVIKKKGKKFKKRITIRTKFKKQARPVLNDLAMQISFSDTPNPNSGMAITKTAPSTAAACAAAGLKQGGGAFFFFASDDSMRLLFQQPEIAFLRPPTT